ncbi:hypothetical protein SEA_CHUPACABRA_70 [Mycobacterium phage Chupacabra]|uniref:Uncharacterized protein n=3 Tax=Fromanvirus goose TaxID=1211282 RepID=A0A291AV36_9CAUD|nr:hypothetical protein FGG46_gp20 [Mycobacterium phage Goose]AFU20696.1 hypothetical protein GOOSE_74 [Mycobacterium phage Goose]ATE84811.1 hypothetical protein OKCENTRAL2016_72 [Mycobacterium phage OKCentral2016]QHB41253.1 hypothetical protein SEA_CHUPACABRA_70 [Mycobacterium phage Chupacabra]
MATALIDTAEAARTKRWIDLLERKLQDAQEKLSTLTPVEPAEEGSVVRFRKYNQIYTFAAIKVGDRWFITQDGSRTSRQGHAPKTWAQLLEWIGERNWTTVEVLS